MNPVRLLAAVSLLALPLLLSACGNKGPLILPPKVPVDTQAGAAPAQEIGDASDAIDETPKADATNAESDLDDDDSDPPENTDTPRS
ncbi:lipoprotein [Lysobacter sp. FW306-1B-D06B]|uniref:LPS translocon maturation chaperone LptM n=1 Tax=Lysobacter sp. FW306-1B-D06B TaxID=3140250 RepID=UPI003140BACC